MTANEELTDLAVRHQLYLTRLQSHEAKQLSQFMREAHDDMAEKLTTRLERIKLRGFDRGPQSTKRLRNLLSGRGKMTTALN